MKIKSLLIYGSLLILLASACAEGKLVTTSVSYQSVKTKHAQPTLANPIPDEAKISVAYSISPSGGLTAVVFNRTSEIMVIDQTMSFFVNSNGISTSYYDPTVKTTSTTDMSSVTKGGSVNLGAVAGAFGIGGIVGDIANGINLGGSGTSGAAVTNTTYVADMPRVSLAPHSNGAMSKVFNIIGIGQSALSTYGKSSQINITEPETYCRFSVCISYSLDGGNNFEKIVTDFYADSKVVVPVTQNGLVNEALRNVLVSKPDALHEPWWLLLFNSNVPGYSTLSQGTLFDYQ